VKTFVIYMLVTLLLRKTSTPIISYCNEEPREFVVDDVALIKKVINGLCIAGVQFMKFLVCYHCTL
jgi:hypothetical protein